MAKHGKRIRKAREHVDRTVRYALDDALALTVKAATAKFDETVEMAVRLGVDPRQADQNVRGTVQLPHGTGKAVRVLVFAKGDKEREARIARTNGVIAISWPPVSSSSRARRSTSGSGSACARTS